MAITQRTPLSEGVSAKKPIYAAAFVEKVLLLVHMGHQRLDHGKCHDWAEEDITGELVRAVNGVLDDVCSPPWCDRLDCREEERVNTGDRRGRRRRRVDISFESSEARPRPRLQFEAKPLKDGRSVTAYLGDDGLGCFFAGQDAYAREHDAAGMLGYVQADDEATWAGRIQSRLTEEPREHYISADGAWRHVAAPDGPSHVYRTRHSRQDPPKQLAVFHVLLVFC